MLYLGHTGAGKTGSLMSLAAAGYNVRIANLDKPAQIIRGYVNDPDSIYRKPFPGLWDKELADTLADRISELQLFEEFQLVGPDAVPRGVAWTKLLNAMNHWQEDDLKLGNICTWGPKDVLAIDGMSDSSKAAMNFILAINNRLGKAPRVGTAEDNDYSAAYRLIRALLEMLKSDLVKCNVIFICHIKPISENVRMNPGAKPMHDFRGFPQTIGSAISPEIGQYFNHALRAKSFGTHPNVRRIILTNNDESVDLKNTRPLKVKQEYRLDTGLAEYFKAVKEQ